MTTLSIPNWKLAPVATAKSPPLRSLKWNTIPGDFEVKKILYFESIYFLAIYFLWNNRIDAGHPGVKKSSMWFFGMLRVRKRIPVEI